MVCQIAHCFHVSSSQIHIRIHIYVILTRPLIIFVFLTAASSPTAALSWIDLRGVEQKKSCQVHIKDISVIRIRYENYTVSARSSLMCNA